MLAEGRISDPWLDGAERFRVAPLRLSASRWRALEHAAEAVAMVHDELATIVYGEPGLLAEFFDLTPWQQMLWQLAAPEWHGIARADVFETANGPVVCELNSDTPSGQAEADWLGRHAVARAGAGHRDASALLQPAVVATVRAFAGSVGAGAGATVGIVYPTEITEDLSMIALYRDWLEAAGFAVVLGSPFNLTAAADGRAALLGTPCDVILRHYKTDWWTERLPVRDDEPSVLDPEPLTAPLTALVQAQYDGRTAVMNPFGAVVTQNKRSLAFCWEHSERFSPAARAAIERYVPQTTRLELCRDELWHDRERWVLKSDYGCEGDGVVIGRSVTQAEWEDVLQHAIPQRWVAQRFFDALVDGDGQVQNHGVYLCGGRAVGAFTRVHAAPAPGIGGTDASARCAAVLVEVEAAEAAAEVSS
ncbi:MAG: glutathionylspermidine synthase family protein [Planctomycetes bacterium]|nr:glutathionylspermidine synthase family protein [Planctomycetota bacterium]